MTSTIILFIIVLMLIIYIGNKILYEEHFDVDADDVSWNTRGSRAKSLYTFQDSAQRVGFETFGDKVAIKGPNGRFLKLNNGGLNYVKGSDNATKFTTNLVNSDGEDLTTAKEVIKDTAKVTAYHWLLTSGKYGLGFNNDNFFVYDVNHDIKVKLYRIWKQDNVLGPKNKLKYDGGISDTFNINMSDELKNFVSNFTNGNGNDYLNSEFVGSACAGCTLR